MIYSTTTGLQGGLLLSKLLKLVRELDRNGIIFIYLTIKLLPIKNISSQFNQLARSLRLAHCNTQSDLTTSLASLIA